MVSGCTVTEENRRFDFIDKKFRAEQLIMQSGIPWFIFRPTWFFESLEMMVRNGKITILGKQNGLYHRVAEDDFGRMVANAYRNEGASSGIYYIYGLEQFRMKALLEKYYRELYPDIKKVTEMLIPMIRLIALLTLNRQLKFAASLFAYFEKVEELEIPEQDLKKLGEAEIDFESWIESKK